VPAGGGFLRRRGRASTALARVQQLVEQRYAEMLVESGFDGESAALVLHPAAEPLELTTPAGGAIVASANTSSVGPGYHAFVCDLLRELGEELGIEWQPADEEHFDETEYFETDNFVALQQQMLDWLGSLARVSLDQIADGATDFALAMPVGDRFASLDVATTPVGPRSREWLEATDRDPRAGADFFSWWELGFGASYLGGRALVDLWTRVPWRPPIDADEERDLRATLSLLRAAHEADPGRPLPWRAWAELASLVDPPEELPARAAANAEDDASPPVGYRRHDILSALPAGWTIRVPGSFATGFDEDATWTAHEGGERSVHVTVYAGIAPDAEPPSYPGDEHRDDRGGVERRAWTTVDETETGSLLLLAGFARAGDSAAQLTVTAEAVGQEWALEVWRSLARAT
jgi:hypothetical protein